MRVEALVSGASDVVGPETTLGDAASVLISRSIGALAVVDGRQVIGILTDRDVVRAVSEGADLDDPVTTWMTDSPDTVPPVKTSVYSGSSSGMTPQVASKS